jgi:hypothetical protein
VRIDPQPALIDTLGYVHLQRSDEQAAAAFRRSRGRPNAPSVRYRLGWPSSRWDSQGARAAFEQALAAGSFPSPGPPRTSSRAWRSHEARSRREVMTSEPKPGAVPAEGRLPPGSFLGGRAVCTPRASPRAIAGPARGPTCSPTCA